MQPELLPLEPGVEFWFELLGLPVISGRVNRQKRGKHTRFRARVSFPGRFFHAPQCAIGLSTGAEVLHDVAIDLTDEAAVVAHLHEAGT